MKGLIGVIIGVVVVGATIVGVLAYQNSQKDNGGLFISITDAAADVSGVSDINVEIKKVEVYNSAKGWITVSSKNKSYNLFELRDSGRNELYAKESIEAGDYSRVRVTLGDVKVKTSSGDDIKAKLPGQEVTINTNVRVREGEESHVKIDILGDRSIHKTAENDFVFAAVVAVESRNNTEVTVGDNDTVTVSGGTVTGTGEVGVDLDGTSKANFSVDSSAGLKVESSLTGVTKFILGGKIYTQEGTVEGNSGATSTDASTKTNIKASVDDIGTKSDINVDINY